MIPASLLTLDAPPPPVDFGAREAARARPEIGPRLDRLAVANFRCYDAAAIDVDGDLIVLTGPNGAGKTNLLEAISMLSPGRGLRRAGLSEIARQADPDAGWEVAATVTLASGPVALRTAYEQSSSGSDRRTLRIDGAPRKGQAVLGELFALAWLTPQMDRLFIEGASGRRRFLDRLVYGFDPGHATELGHYEQAMRERARLLRAGRFEEAWLAGLEDAMARHGVAVAASRRETVARLGALMNGPSARDGDPFPAARMTLTGMVETALDTRPAVDVETDLRATFARQRRVDAESGVTTSGPHRGDLAVTHAAKNVAAEHCSTGEQKALLIAIQLAAARALTSARGAPPILLLDEIAAHLDETRRDALFTTLAALGCQAWMTGTDAALFDGVGLTGRRAQFFSVEDGRVAPSATGAGV